MTSSLVPTNPRALKFRNLRVRVLIDVVNFNQARIGDRTPLSGIYRCEACGREDACDTGDPLRPEKHAQHDPSRGAVKWRLTVVGHGRV